ncbi:hypothetical protein D1007_62221 [Hordeum vulgare]|nr:hypothetical protein D1007_62221 [Hordeum vulgare]
MFYPQSQARGPRPGHEGASTLSKARGPRSPDPDNCLGQLPTRRCAHECTHARRPREATPWDHPHGVVRTCSCSAIRGVALVPLVVVTVLVVSIVARRCADMVVVGPCEPSRVDVVEPPVLPPYSVKCAGERWLRPPSGAESCTPICSRQISSRGEPKWRFRACPCSPPVAIPGDTG